MTAMPASRLILLALLLAPLPALAQDADPSNQLLEGYVACAMGDASLLLSRVAWRPLIGIDAMLDDVLQDWLQRIGT